MLIYVIQRGQYVSNWYMNAVQTETEYVKSMQGRDIYIQQQSGAFFNIKTIFPVIGRLSYLYNKTYYNGKMTSLYWNDPFYKLGLKSEYIILPRSNLIVHADALAIFQYQSSPWQQSKHPAESWPLDFRYSIRINAVC